MQCAGGEDEVCGEGRIRMRGRDEKRGKAGRGDVEGERRRTEKRSAGCAGRWRNGYERKVACSTEVGEGRRRRGELDGGR
ncbi:hypothetical protein C8R44DRAFT_232282 [Mycena epipterygia]|nr:hypothetical protein C8R44DRAFT_232282 [Mycena epipterygia]